MLEARCDVVQRGANRSRRDHPW